MKSLSGNPFRMKALTLSQARECETAQNPKCVCRCGGKGHGSSRLALHTDNSKDSREHDRALFAALPEDDDHRLLPENEDKALAKLRARLRKFHFGYHIRKEWNGAGFTVSLRFSEPMPMKDSAQHGWGERAVIAEFQGPCPLCVDGVVDERRRSMIS